MSCHLLCLGSQNHRIFRGGRDLWRPSSQTPLPRQGHVEQFIKGCALVMSECLWRGRLQDLPEHPFPVLCHPQQVLQKLWVHPISACGFMAVMPV